MKRIARLNLLLAAGVATSGITPAFAQSNQDTTLAPIVVEGNRSQDPKGPVKGFVATTSASASKTGRALVETQQSVTVITRDQIEAQDAQTLGDVLSYAPGVVGEPYGSDPRFDSPNIRGFDGRQVQFLDGLRLMRTAGAPALEIYGMERVDVLLGPSSVMYGQGNPGGMINMISKRPTFEKSGEVGVGIGSFDYYQGFFDFGGPVSEGSDVAYRFVGLGRKAGEQTDSLNNDRFYIAPSVTWQPDEDTKLTVLSSMHRDNPSSPSGLPIQLTLNANANNRLSRDFYVGDESFDHSDRRLYNIGYELEHRFNDTFTFRQNLRYAQMDWEYRALGMASTGLAANGRTINRTATIQDELLNTFNVDNHIQAEFSTGGIDHTLLVGLDYRHFDNDVRTEFWSATGLDAFAPVYGSVRLNARTLYTKVDSTLTQAGLYAQDELEFGNWRATLGLRQDFASTEGKSANAAGVARSLNKDDEKLTGRAGLGYLFDNGVAPYISYATSFEPVPVPASGNLLEPTTGEQVEVGVKYQPEGFDGYFSAALYDLRQQNVLTTVVQGGVPVSAQIGEVHVQGLELQGVASLAEGLDLRAAYTAMKAEIVNGPDNGKRPDNLPEQTASLWLNYTFQPDTALEGLGIGGGVRYVGQRFGNTANTISLEGVTLFDAALTYSRNGYKASLNVQNIADNDYVSNCGTFGCYYGEGRTIMGKLSYSW